jgi:hypothetical protein
LTEDLAAILARADRLGFCVLRVATALGISAQDLAAIQAHIDSRGGGRSGGPPTATMR